MTLPEKCVALSACFCFASIALGAAGLFVPTSDSRGFVSYEHNFGELHRMETGEHLFRIKNEINSPLTIHRIIPSCGCTVVDQNLIGKKVDAGGVFEVPVRWTGVSEAGRYTSRVLVTFQRAAQRPAELMLRAEVVP